jgi:branched-chain amino acid transport system permease protein
MPLPPWSPLLSRTIFLEAMLGLLVITILLARAIQHGRAGLGLTAIREDEDAAGTIGVNAPRLKLEIFVLSAAITGAVGGIYVFDRVFIVPESVFDLHLSIALVLMALFGGRDSWIGPLVGAVVIRLLEEVLRIYVGAEFANIVFGLMLAVVIVFLPNGLLSLSRWRRAATPAEAA